MEVPATNTDECCGNGCAHCILDDTLNNVNLTDESGKLNIILNYTGYKLISKIPHQPELKDFLELHFICADLLKSADYILHLHMGHHIMMRALIDDEAANEHKNFRLRPYSPFWVDRNSLEFKILINMKRNTPMIRFIDKLNIGNVVEFRGPLGKFIHVPDEIGQQCLIIITQGVAVAPSIRIIEAILNNDMDMSRLCHFACFQDLNNILFRQRLFEYNKYWNFKGRIYLSRQNCKASTCTIDGCTVNCETFKKNLRYKEGILPYRLTAEKLASACENVKKYKKIFILCGSRSFQDDMFNNIKMIYDDVIDNDINLL